MKFRFISTLIIFIATSCGSGFDLDGDGRGVNRNGNATVSIQYPVSTAVFIQNSSHPVLYPTVSGLSDMTFSITSIPSGLSFDSDTGGITGTPTGTGSNNVTVTVTGTDDDGNEGTATTDIELYIDNGFLVNSTGDGGDGSMGNGYCNTAAASLKNDDCTLRAAIQESEFLAGDQTILIPNLTIVPTATLQTSTVNGDMNIVGWGTDETIIDGNSSVQVMQISNASWNGSIKHLTLRNGTAPTGGGGLYGFGQSIVLEDLLIEANLTTTEGGGVSLNSFTTVTISDVTFSGNSANANGGALSLSSISTSARIDNCVFQYNSTTNNGGAIYESMGAGVTIDVTNSLFEGNSANNIGGVIYKAGTSTVAFENSTFYGNQSIAAGGVIAANAGTLGVRHSTFVSNGSATAGTGGISMNSGSIITFIADIFYDSKASGVGDDCLHVSGATISGGYNISDNAWSCGTATTGDFVSTDARLGTFADNGGSFYTFLPDTTSPAIDSASDGTCPAEDARGYSRPYDVVGLKNEVTDTCDRGAVEVQVEDL